MTDHAGDLDLLHHSVAQHLLTSTAPAQLAYTWLDGTPRTVPMWFHWDGSVVYFGTQPNAPKVAALRANPVVAISIDEHVWPYPVLYLRGTASIEVLDDISPEYVASAERYFGPEQGQAWAGQLRGKPMARVRVSPEWANVIDFQTRFPSALSV